MDSAKTNSDCQKTWNMLDIFEDGKKDGDMVNYGILILNQPIHNDPDMIKSLWKAAKVRFTVDGGTNQWLKFIQENSGEDLPLPDRITGDFDSITDTTKDYFKRKCVIFVETKDQNYTDFTKALMEIGKMITQENLKLNHILALCANSGRMDQIMGNLETLHIAKNFLPDIPIVLMSISTITTLLKGGKTHVIKVPEQYLHLPFAVGLIPLKGPTNVTTTGLKWNLDNTRLAFGELVSTSNRFSQRTVKIMSELDLVWTVQYSLVETY